MEWQMRAIRGATTVAENTVEAMREVVTELLDELENRNQFQTSDIISVTFSVTRDLDAIFPAAIARSRPGWDNVAMLDVQQMHVEGSLQRCIRFLIHAYLPASASIHHIYLRNAASLRPDWSLPQSLQTSQPAVKSKV
ncbi:chorismate mutase [Nostoc linckia z18]|uniref:chorismate mutase n=4 Tax=Nostoc TaxID=1177 RepID=A0A9Q5ZGG2_NOSLI|nr:MULTISPECIES: chorismate mutase [Nostoc]MBL1199333.1 chorismate mutase [Nostoc sp. GBBB01]MDZ8011380.1 chorismate mutase [Nostoc sp. ZfuVER08]PHJ92754.1 chorismate mutase [Nostoc linckia z6]PHK31006.1 chorismate mutase [Nostoc linckia z15]PHK48177.1 chorismate mutase [Nostoc linckia z16]